jgi:hypothetical protein
MWRPVDLVWTDVSEERRFPENLHGPTSQETELFIVTAVETSDLTKCNSIYTLFNDIFNCSEYSVERGRLMNEVMNCARYGWKHFLPNLDYTHSICLEGVRKSKKNFHYNSRTLGQDL